MKGFITKDLYLIKGNLKTIIIVLLGFGIMAFNGMYSMAIILPFMCVMLSISTFSYDDYNKWDAYAITFPNGKKNSVKGKYLFTILLILISSVVTLMLTILIAYLKDTLNIKELIETTTGGILGTIAVMGIMYPILYKFGSEKGKMVIFIGVFFTTFVFSVLLKGIQNLHINSEPLITFMNQYGSIVIPIAICILIIILTFVSYKISKKIYEKKEF